ncbi:MAG: MOFRL family protein [Rubrivivax sp.]
MTVRQRAAQARARTRAAAAAPASSCSAAPPRCAASLAFVLAADTDGIDGVEANAGAIVTPDTLARAQAHEGSRCLDRNDAYSFFAALGDLVVPGPTFTNVLNDFRALLVI